MLEHALYESYMCRDAHEREKSCSSESEQGLTYSGKERKT